MDPKPSQNSLPRICFLTEGFYPILGGVETSCRQLAENFVENGMKSLVITRQVTSEWPRFEYVGKVPVFRIPPRGYGHLKKWQMLLPALVWLIKLRNECDILCVLSFKGLGIPGVIASKLLGKKCVLRAESPGEMSGLVFKDGLAKMHMSSSSIIYNLFLSLRNKLIRRADLFLSISSDIQRELISYGVNVNKIKRIPPCGVDTSKFRPVNLSEQAIIRKQLGIPQNKTVVGFIGRLLSSKGLPLLIKVWKNIAHEYDNVLLLLVGSGGSSAHNCESELKNFVRDNDLQDKVIFVGDVSNVHVHEYFQASDIYAFPSESEGFSVALLEAMACGLSIITSDKGNFKDIIVNGENGIMVSINDGQELYKALETLIVNKGLAISLGKEALKTVRENYSMESVTKKYIDIFSDVAAIR